MSLYVLYITEDRQNRFRTWGRHINQTHLYTLLYICTGYFFTLLLFFISTFFLCCGQWNVSFILSIFLPVSKRFNKQAVHAFTSVRGYVLYSAGFVLVLTGPPIDYWGKCPPTDHRHWGFFPPIDHPLQGIFLTPTHAEAFLPPIALGFFSPLCFSLQALDIIFELCCISFLPTKVHATSFSTSKFKRSFLPSYHESQM